MLTEGIPKTKNNGISSIVNQLENEQKSFNV